MSSSNCCFLTCIQVSQEAGQVVWYSRLLKNFPQFVVIHFEYFLLSSLSSLIVFFYVQRPIKCSQLSFNFRILISSSRKFTWFCFYKFHFSKVSILFHIFIIVIKNFNSNIQFTSGKAMAPHSSTLAWKIPWMEEPGRLQSMGLLGVGHNWANSLSLFTFTHWRRKWQPTPVFLPGESQGQRSLVGCRLWSRTESDTTEAT